MPLRRAKRDQTRFPVTEAYACSPAADLRRYEGKLHAVTTDFPGEAGVTYEYGGDGKRRSRVSGAEETWYNWDREWNVVSEEDDADGSSGTLSRTYIAGAQTIEQVESILADVGGTDPATGDYRHYALDHLGSVRGLYDGTKSAVAAAEYEPYGGVYAESGVAMPYAFTGKPYDGASGLHYFPYRYYASEQLRWMTRDPAEMVDGPNVYLYVTVSPANGFDLMGLKVDWPSTSTIDDCMEDKDFPCADEVMEALGLGDSSGHAIPQGFVYSERPGSLRQVSFRRCCCGHDNCSQRFACDFNWYRCMVGECSDELTRGSRLWRRCRNMALFYFTVVRLFNMSQGVF
jgi:RHS repeat-associated protein